MALVGERQALRLSSQDAKSTYTSARRGLGAGPAPVGTYLAVETAGSWSAVPDGNRSVVLDTAPLEFDGRTWHLSVKGAGARTPMFGAPLDAREPPWSLCSEAWMGEAPYGGQGDVNTSRAVELTERATGCCWNGFWLCPVVAVVEVPPAVVEAAADRFWYRRHEGRALQEHRLVPSNVRLFHQSERTLGQHPTAVLDALGVRDVGTLDGFLDRYIRSGLAALTLYARTLEDTPSGPRALDYGDVWLDKDSVLAADGTLFFADLEGLEWVRPTAERDVATMIREQFDRSYYEWLYGLDVLLRERERLEGTRHDRVLRRRHAVAHVDVALEGDPWLRLEWRKSGVDLCVEGPRVEPVRLRMFDA